MMDYEDKHGSYLNIVGDVEKNSCIDKMFSTTGSHMPKWVLVASGFYRNPTLSASDNDIRKFHIITYNDVYELEPIAVDGHFEGGASRAVHYVKEYRKEHGEEKTLALFA